MFSCLETVGIFLCCLQQPKVIISLFFLSFVLLMPNPFTSTNNQFWCSEQHTHTQRYLIYYCKFYKVAGVTSTHKCIFFKCFFVVVQDQASLRQAGHWIFLYAVQFCAVSALCSGEPGFDTWAKSRPRARCESISDYRARSSGNGHKNTMQLN